MVRTHTPAETLNPAFFPGPLSKSNFSLPEFRLYDLCCISLISFQEVVATNGNAAYDARMI